MRRHDTNSLVGYNGCKYKMLCLVWHENLFFCICLCGSSQKFLVLLFSYTFCWTVTLEPLRFLLKFHLEWNHLESSPLLLELCLWLVSVGDRELGLKGWLIVGIWWGLQTGSWIGDWATKEVCDFIVGEWRNLEVSFEVFCENGIHLFSSLFVDSWGPDGLSIFIQRKDVDFRIFCSLKQIWSSLKLYALF